MTPWELGLAALLYCSVAIRYWNADNGGMALAFLAYAFANIGFIWSALKEL